MLLVKSCNLKHNSESVFRYFASAVNITRAQNVIEKIFILSVVIEASRKNRLCSFVHLSQIVVSGIQRFDFISPCTEFIFS